MGAVFGVRKGRRGPTHPGAGRGTSFGDRPMGLSPTFGETGDTHTHGEAQAILAEAVG